MSAVMLAVIVVAIAWCAYQSTLWSGVQTFKLRDANSANSRFIMKTLQQGQSSTVDAMVFIQYINSLQEKNKDLSDFYYQSFRPDMKIAVDAWLKTDPMNNPNSPRTPFQMTEYNRTFAMDANNFLKESSLRLEEAQNASNISDKYVLMTVIYAVVLFIGSIMGKMFSNQIRLMLLAVGLGITSVATIIVLFLPVTT